MGKKPGEPAKNKGLSAHQAGLAAPHGKISYSASSGESEEPLTEAEGQVLLRVAEDMKNEEIGRDLQIAKATVEKHLEKIYEKLGVHSRTSAAIWLLRRENEALRNENATLKAIIAGRDGSSATAPTRPD